MKVKVYVKCVQPTQTEEYLHELLSEHQEELAHAYAEMEKLIQENKDLRVDMAHTQDELNLIRQQSEVRRQKLTEKDALIAELNEQIEACEQEIKNWVADTQSKMEIQEELGDTIANLRSELHDRNARVAELEQRITFLEDQAAVHREEKGAFEDALRGFKEMRQEYQKELAEAHAEKRGWMNKFTELEEQKKRDDKKSEETCTACNEIYERVLAERNQARAEVARLTEERDTAVSENTQMVFELEECRDQLTSAHKRIEEQQRTISDAGNTISNLQAKLTANEIAPALDRLFRMMGEK